jgi:aspartate/methionine/tyrosine aminotransferase
MQSLLPDLPFVAPQGTGFVFPDVTAFGRPSSEVAALLLDGYGIPCVPGSVFHGEGRVRMGFGGTPAVQHELLKALARAFADAAGSAGRPGR